jgi:hypothetical protein
MVTSGTGHDRCPSQWRDPDGIPIAVGRRQKNLEGQEKFQGVNQIFSGMGSRWLTFSVLPRPQPYARRSAASSRPLLLPRRAPTRRCGRGPSVTTRRWSMRSIRAALTGLQTRAGFRRRQANMPGDVRKHQEVEYPSVRFSLMSCSRNSGSALHWLAAPARGDASSDR